MKIKKILATFVSVLMLCSLFFSVTASAIVQYSEGFKFEPTSTRYAEVIGIQPGSTTETSEIITIPASLKGYTINSIGKNAFSYNYTQKEIIMPNTITEIGDYAFTEAKALKTATIPQKVQNLGSHVFSECTSLERVTFNTNRLYVIPKATFYGCTALDNVILPDSINTIEDFAFSYCTNLKRIYIPSTVSSISEVAFSDCNNLTIYGEEGSTIHYYALRKNIPFVSLTSDKATTEISIWIVAAQNKLKADTSEFPQETVNQLRAELDRALEIRADFFSTQAQIDEVAQSLSNICKLLKPSYIVQLEEVVAQANILLENSNLYTEDTVNELSKAIVSAQEVIDKPSPTATDASYALNLVNEKINALVFQSKIDLQNLINTANSIINSAQYQYTESSINNLVLALDEANKVLKASDSTNENYQVAYDELNNAYSALVKITKGDVNFDSEITVKDALFVLKYVVGSKQFNEREIYAADLSEDGNVTVLDAILIQRAIVSA